MARKIKLKLPPRCELRPSGKIRYRPLRGKSMQLNLPAHAPMEDVWAYYKEHITTNKYVTWRYLCESYCQSPRFKRLKARSKKDYERYAKSLGRTLCDTNMSDMRAVHVAKWRDKRAFGINGAPEQANKELKFLKLVISHAVEYELLGINYQNTIRDVKPVIVPKENKATFNKKLMTREMFLKIRSCCSVEVQVAATLSYITGLRLGDVLSLKKADVAATGEITKQQNKTEISICKSVSKALNETIEAALDLPGHRKNYSCEWLIPNKQGLKYTENGFQSNWQRGRLKAYPKVGDTPGGAPPGYRTRFHDLRHRGTTDFDASEGRSKADFTGHTGVSRDSMAAAYDENSQLPITSPSLEIDLPKILVE